MVYLRTFCSYVSTVIFHELLNNVSPVAIFLILMPQLPYYIMLSSFYFVTTHSTAKFIIHLALTSALTLLTLTYLIICSTRDPGFVQPLRDRGKMESIPGQESEQALLQRDAAIEENAVESLSDTEIEQLVILGKWCRKCSIRRPERAHHCSSCGRCVLKMGSSLVRLHPRLLTVARSSLPLAWRKLRRKNMSLFCSFNTRLKLGV